MTDESAIQGSLRFLEEAAGHLAELARHLLNTLKLDAGTVVFAGSLLTTDNLLSQQVTQKLKLIHSPLPRFSAVIGAAILAKSVR